MLLSAYSLIIPALAAAAGVGFILIRWLHQIFAGPLRSVPGPFYTRFTRLPYKYHALTNNRSPWIDALHKKYGKVVRLAPDEVSIIDLASVKEIHKVSTQFLKSSWYHELMARQTPNMFAMRDPHAHRSRRALLASGMSDNSLKKMEPIVNENIDKAMYGLAAENAQLGAADILKWFMYMTTDIIGELTFGESFKMLDNPAPNQYFQDLKTLGKMDTIRTEFGVPVTNFLATIGIEPFSNAMKIFERFGGYSQESLTRYEKLVEADPENPKPTLFSKLFTKESDGALTRFELIRESLAYIVAGSDTTAITTTYLVYHVLRNPSIRDRLLSELNTNLRGDNFSWEDVRALPYLSNVIQETLRLCTAAPGPLPRDVPAQGANLSGYHLPGGTIVSTQAYSLHRDSSIWHEPETFNPDRWNAPTPEMNAAFMPFGAGTRICIGMHLARDEMRYAAATFFKRFPNARVVESDANMQQEAYLLMGPKGKKCFVELGEKVRA